MMDSQMNTVVVQTITSTTTESGDTPSLLAQANKTALRVVVRNIGFGAYILLSYDAATLQSSPVAASTYQLPPGLSDVFILAPGQKLYAATPGISSASVATSEAVPVDLKAPLDG